MGADQFHLLINLIEYITRIVYVTVAMILTNHCRLVQLQNSPSKDNNLTTYWGMI